MNQQNITFMPTAAEKKLLTVLANPEMQTKSITKICEEAGVSRQVYYNAIQKPEFLAYCNDAMMRLLKGKVRDVLAATFRFAVENPQNHQDRKMLLEMAGIYQSKPQELTGVAIGVSFEGFLESVAPAIEGTKLEEANYAEGR